MTWLFWGFEMSAILLVWQILLVSLSRFVFLPQGTARSHRRCQCGLPSRSPVWGCRRGAGQTCRDYLAFRTDLGKQPCLPPAPVRASGQHLANPSSVLERMQGVLMFLLFKALASSPWHCGAGGFAVTCGGSAGWLLVLVYP